MEISSRNSYATASATLRTDDLKPVKAVTAAPTPAMQADVNAMRARQAEVAKILEASKHTTQESHVIALPEITSLSRDDAVRTVGVVKALIDQKADRGMTVDARFGDKRVTSLAGYLDLLSRYIGEYPKRTK